MAKPLGDAACGAALPATQKTLALPHSRARAEVDAAPSHT